MREWAVRVTRFRPLRNTLYWVQYLIATVLTFPLTWYQGVFTAVRWKAESIPAASR
jgi:hypothetical protein